MYYFTDELYHHGILGQKWGIRRYQNKDGTLTEAGRKHYATEFKKNVDSSAGTHGAKVASILNQVKAVISPEQAKRVVDAKKKFTNAALSREAYNQIGDEANELLDKNLDHFIEQAKKNLINDGEDPDEYGFEILYNDADELAWQTALSNHPAWAAQEQKREQYLQDYLSETKKVAMEILGEDYPIRGNEYDRLSVYVTSAIERLDSSGELERIFSHK